MTARLAVPDALGAYVDSGTVSAADVEAARVLLSLAGNGTRPLRVWLAVALCLRTVRDGHSCLDLGSLDLWGIAAGDTACGADPEPWLADLQSAVDLVGAPDVVSTPRTPLVLDGDRLYLRRVHAEEVAVARRLLLNGARGVTVILGGPGTGKTTLVASRLAAMSDDEVGSIALCAPTGKAARHMKTVLVQRATEQNASPAVRAALEAAPSVTAHRLLGYAPGRNPRWRHNSREPLDVSLVIVDETSMMSLSTMARLLDALRPGTDLWLVGDPDQLASVESGTVLADIAEATRDPKSLLSAHVVPLVEQHRFDKDSPIALLAAAVRDGDEQAALDVLRSGAPGLTWIDPDTQVDALNALAGEVVTHARALARAAVEGRVADALRLKNDLQVLSAVRAGRLGVREWNAKVEAALGPAASADWYPGRPVLVLRNDPALNLANGDVGVVCRVNGEDRAWFGLPNDPWDVAIARLPNVETVHALTIHKSQGSEYEKVVVVLPAGESRIVTRELLYTGVSRPRKELVVVATEAQVRAAVGTEVRRATGLADRL